MSNEMETRTVNSPRTGTKVSLILAASALAVAVYYYMTPTHFTGKDGGLFGCGSPMSPNNNSLGKSQCHIIETAGLHKSLLFLALALITAVLGTLLFGMDKKVQDRVERDDVDDDDALDEHDHDDHDERRARSGFLAGRQERKAFSRKKSPRRPRFGEEDDDDFDDDSDDEFAEQDASDNKRSKARPERRAVSASRREDVRDDDEPRDRKKVRRESDDDDFVEERHTKVRRDRDLDADDQAEARKPHAERDRVRVRDTRRDERRGGARYGDDAFDQLSD